LKNLAADDIAKLEVELDKDSSLDEVVVMVMEVKVEISRNMEEISAIVLEFPGTLEACVVFIQLVELGTGSTGSSVAVAVDDFTGSVDGSLASKTHGISIVRERDRGKCTYS